eukprot:5493056-Amphidinium_carterae.1
MLQQKKLNRGYYSGQKGKTSGQGGKGQSKGYQKNTLENLIARTRCAICKQKGHWKRECPQKGSQSSGTTLWTTQLSTSEAPFFVGWTGFIGLVTATDTAIVDTGAESGCVGEQAMLRIEANLKSRGLWVRDLLKGKSQSTNGIGGHAEIVRRCVLPIGLGGINGLLRVTVVKGEVP